MANLKTEGRIEQAQGRIRSTWGDLTDDDFERARGNGEVLVGRIKEKTGDTTQHIRHKLDQLDPHHHLHHGHAGASPAQLLVRVAVVAVVSAAVVAVAWSMLRRKA
jgi:uncharacterized protein YjbJ (UPF0337 family)